MERKGAVSSKQNACTAAPNLQNNVLVLLIKMHVRNCAMTKQNVERTGETRGTLLDSQHFLTKYHGTSIHSLTRHECSAWPRGPTVN